MSAKNDTIVNDVVNLSQDDLVDVYEKLAESYRRLKQENEECKQKFHHQKLQVKMLLSSQRDLQSELESINVAHQDDLQDVLRKNSSVVDHLKNKNSELLADKSQLESKIDELNSHLLRSQREYEELKIKLVKPQKRMSDSFAKNLELENENLRTMLNEMLTKLNEIESQGLVKQSRIEELNEQILCLEDNLESKKIEVDEKTDAIESFQEKIHEMTVELAMLRSAPDDANRKGNSLFAEVDDQRQKMKVILQGERSHYLEMKKSYNAKEVEIRRLKRENMNIKQEIETCSSLLMRGEQIAIQALSAQVSQLQCENRRLEGLLEANQKNLIDLANEQNLGWIDSLLSTASSETRDLKDKQVTLMMQKTLLAENLNKIQRELAKARLDCVKFKMLVARLLDANSIQFNPYDYFDIGLDDDVLESLKTEEYEALSDPNETINNSDVLSESEIVLLGGRKRLGPLISPPTPAREVVSRSEDEAAVNEENLLNQIKSETVKTPTKSPAKPLKQLQPCMEKAVKFSKVIESIVIDSTQEQFEQSKQARKRQGIIVKRIIIPSKAPLKTIEKL